MNNTNFTGQGVYEIKVKGHIDEAWSSWFEGMAIKTGYAEDGTPVTTITGQLDDQAELHGVIGRIRDINMPLISVYPANDVNQVEKGSQDES
jgi:hypothetical protein